MTFNLARHLGAGLILTLAVGAQAADAPEEVVLHIVAQGVARTAPDKIVATFWTSEQGDSAEAAKAAFQAQIDRRRAELGAAGVAVIVAGTAEPTTTAVAEITRNVPLNPIPPPTTKLVPAVAPPPLMIRPPLANKSGRFQTTGQVEFTINDAGRLNPTQLALVRSTFPGTLKATVIDERRGHEAAVADAAAKARADAAIYAADMGFHVVRVKALGNDGGVDVMNVLAAIQRASSASISDPTSVQVTASIRVDFVVAPN